MNSRIVSAIALVVAALVLLLVAWPQLFGAELWIGVAHVVSLRGLGMAAAGILIIVLLLIALASPKGRRFAAALALILLVFVGLNGAVVSSRGLGDGAFETKGESSVTVLTWNTLGDAVSADDVASLVLEHDVDIVTLPETTRQFATEVAELLGRAGHPMWAHTFARDEISKSRSTSLLTGANLGTYSFRDDSSPTRQFPTVVARPDSGSGPTIIAVHVVAPIPQYLDSWRSDLSALATLCTGNVIMAGDFNATLDHFASLAGSVDTDFGLCNSATAATGNGSVGTWPAMLSAFLGAPIDHIMATDGWRVTGARVIESLDKAGSDHRPVLAQLQPMR